MRMHKKGAFFVGALVIIVLVLFIALLQFERYECTKNIHCGETMYCGVDNKCHEFPHQEKMIESYTKPAALFGLIIAAAIIVGSLILKERKKPPAQTYYESPGFQEPIESSQMFKKE